MLKIRRSHRPIFNTGIPIPGKDGLYIEMGLCYLYACLDFLVTTTAADALVTQGTRTSTAMLLT